MNRTEIVKEIMSNIKDGDVVVSSTGYISREVYRYDRDLNFYMMGSMGNALAIGIGIALNYKGKVYVINGDGSALMGLGSLVTAQSLNLENLHHFIIDNHCHESTGGQKTSSIFSRFEDLHKNTIVFEADKDSNIPPRITLSCKQITERFKNAMLRIKEKQEISE